MLRAHQPCPPGGQCLSSCSSSALTEAESNTVAVLPARRKQLQTGRDAASHTGPEYRDGGLRPDPARRLRSPKLHTGNAPAPGCGRLSDATLNGRVRPDGAEGPHPAPAAARGSRPRPRGPGPAPAGLRDSAPPPPRAAGDPRCMCNGAWEQRLAGPGAPTSPGFALGLQRAALHAARGRPEPPELDAEPVRTRTPSRARPSSTGRGKALLRPRGTRFRGGTPRVRTRTHTPWTTAREPRRPPAPATCVPEAQAGTC